MCSGRYAQASALQAGQSETAAVARLPSSAVGMDWIEFTLRIRAFKGSHPLIKREFRGFSAKV